MIHFHHPCRHRPRNSSLRPWQWLPLWTVICLPLSLTGCRVDHQLAALASDGATDYGRMEIIYQTHPADGPMFLDDSCIYRPTSRLPWRRDSEASSSKVQSAGHRDDAYTADDNAECEDFVAPERTWAIVELRVQYPHPDPTHTGALATLRLRPIECCRNCQRGTPVERQHDWVKAVDARRATRRERLQLSAADPRESSVVAELELSREELEQVMATLVDHEFFTAAAPRTPGSQLEVRLDRRWSCKPWNFEPVLDDLLARVYAEGHLQSTDDASPAPPKRSLRPIGRIERTEFKSGVPRPFLSAVHPMPKRDSAAQLSAK